MKKLTFLLIICFICVSCYCPVVPHDTEPLLAQWTASTVVCGNMNFTSILVVKGVNVPIFIIKQNNRWYFWSDTYGYGDEIFIEN